MNYLPQGFPTHLLPDPLDLAKVEAFCRRYTGDYYAHYQYGHFLMAAYASVPALLTPDLLYRIWMNFSTYRLGERTLVIHRVAVSDLLLSGLCRETGYELYEMPDAIRMAFRRWLLDAQGQWEEMGLAKAADIAAFVEEYHATDNPGTRRWGKTHTIRQTIEAVAIRNPAEAQRRYIEWLSQVPGSKKIEQHRVLDYVSRQRTVQLGIHAQESLDDPTSSQYISPEFQHNGLLADIQKAVLQDDRTALERLVRENTDALREHVSNEKPEGESIRLELPGSLARGLYEPPAVHALLIGVNTYADPEIPPLQGCLNDMDNMQRLLGSYRQKMPALEYHITALQDREATIKAVEGQLKNWETESANGDTLLLHFSGRDLYNERGRILVLHDSRYKEGEITGLYQTDLEERLLDIALQKRVHIVLLLDTCYNIGPNQYKAMAENRLRTNNRTLQGSLIEINAAEVGKMAYERSIEGKSSGDFTRNLADIVAKHDTLDYRTLLAKVQEALGEQQRPLMEAFPASAVYSQFLTGKSGAALHTIRYDRERNMWVLEAGLIKGIAPSAGFFPTLLRTGNGQEWKVDAVSENEATLLSLGQPASPLDIFKSHEAILVQNAPFKTRVALAEAGRVYLQEAIQPPLEETNYAFPVSNPAEADIIIGVEGDPPHSYYITKENPKNTDAAVDPLIPPASAILLLMEQLRPATRFFFILRMSGNNAALKNRVAIQLEMVEDYAIGETDWDSLPGVLVEENALNPEYQQQPDGSWFRPAFRCGLLRKTAMPVYVYGFYCNTAIFNIEPLGEIALPAPPTASRGIGWEDAPVYLANETFKTTISLSGRQVPPIGSKATDYVLLFFTTAPANLQMLTQTVWTAEAWGMECNDEMMWNVAEWDVVRIPVELSSVEAKVKATPKKKGQKQSKTLPPTATAHYLQTLEKALSEGEAEAVLDSMEYMDTHFNLGLGSEIGPLKAQQKNLKNLQIRGTIAPEESQLSMASLSNSTRVLIQERLANPQYNIPMVACQPLVPDLLAQAAGASATDQMAWLQQALVVARSICQITDGEQVRATGFLTTDGSVWTCRHVLREITSNVQVIFGEGHNETGIFMSGGVAYDIETSNAIYSEVDELDFVRLTLADRSDAPLSQWGGLEIAASIPEKGEALQIAHFLEGNKKQFDGSPSAVLGHYQQDLLYNLPTGVGSSGAPVLNKEGKVVAIHRKKSDTGKEGFLSDDQGSRVHGKAGVLMEKILEHIDRLTTPKQSAY